ncbi:MAG TPA: ferritin-like domain-containing protein [Pyrinomonadaceae bacterium]|jgi:rubrerythrin|nr:ferritin-like domain-containing protein [Pyrinomonadaceae bacterium]
MATKEDNRQKLIAILQLAYSGERAAAYAYRGHWHSVSAPHERDTIRKIEEDEWRHRQLVGEMLSQLGASPHKRREIKATIIGRTLGFLCHVSGWLAPMYGAGKLESRNIREYETAARCARDCGAVDFVDCLLEMAQVEWDHEDYFRSCVLKHRLGHRLPIWPQPPAKEMIRLSYEHERIVHGRETETATIAPSATLTIKAMS